jgi:hypothetical protein
MRSVLLFSLLVTLLGCVGRPEPTPATMHFRAGFGNEANGLAPGWMGYAMARMVGDSQTGAQGPSADPAPFGEEAHARESLALIWGELAKKDGYRDRYLEDLVRIQKAGFIREYTWTCVLERRSSPHADLMIRDFAAWLIRELPNHEVETHVRAVLRDGGIVVEVGWTDAGPRPCFVESNFDAV